MVSSSVCQQSSSSPLFLDPGPSIALARAREHGAVIVEPAPLPLRPLERFAFTHIPKTAGLTLRAILAIVCNSNNWPWEEILGSWQDGENGALGNYRSRSPEALRRAQIVWGHLPYGIHGTGQPHVALLRDPVERMISSYAMGLAGGSYPPGKSIADLAAEGYFDDNLQTRLLSGRTDQVRKGSTCAEEVLAQALENLQSGYVLAADTERFNDFVAVMLRLLGAPPILFFRRNVRALDFARRRDRRIAPGVREARVIRQGTL